MSDKFLRMPDVIKKVGLRRTAIYDKISSGDFPQPVKLGIVAAFSKKARGWDKFLWVVVSLVFLAGSATFSIISLGWKSQGVQMDNAPAIIFFMLATVFAGLYLGARKVVADRDQVIAEMHSLLSAQQKAELRRHYEVLQFLLEPQR